jgi:hypothetical protein
LARVKCQQEDGGRSTASFYGTSASFSDARQLEDIYFNQWISEGAVEMSAKMQALERSLAARGLGQSGARFQAEVDIIFGSIEGIVERAIGCRRELGARVPALLEPSNLNGLKDKLNRCVDDGVNGVRQRMTLQPTGAAGPNFIQEAERKAYALKARLSQKLAALPLEGRLGVHQREESKTTTFNISNSTIANLNLGNVVGDLNSSIQHLNSEGRNEMAEGFRKMTEAIGSSQDLNDDARKELLEHLVVVSGEAAKPPEKRKMAPLKTSVEAIRSGIGIATQLLTLWEAAERALKSAGINLR